jgi:pantothenate kinase
MTPGPPGQPVDPVPPVLHRPPLDALVRRARALAVPGQRHILGILGPPGAGKTTLAEAVCHALGDLAVLVPMDGFHRANEDLVRMGLRDRKGAPATFDAVAFVALLRRLRDARDVVAMAPRFDRDADAAVPDAIAVPREVPLVVTEGNYLLLEDEPWAAIRGLLDEAWYLRSDETRVERLIRRHIEHGKAPDHANDWVHRSDEANARLVERTEVRADLVIDGLPAIPAD